MSAYLSPVGNEQQSDANGAPVSGGQIFTYAAGTTTPIATYTGSDGLTPQANPIILNAAGLPDSPIWLPGGQAVKFVIKDSDGVTLRTVDDLTGINDPAQVTAPSEWVAYAGGPTHISGTSFSVEGDQTSVFQVGRRLKAVNTGGTVYGSVDSSSYDAFTGLTTVTVSNDSGALDPGLSAVSYGLVSITSTSAPIASQTYRGVVELATPVEAQAGTDAVRVITPSTMKAAQIVLGTAVATTSGASIDFTGIPSYANRVNVMFQAVSTNGASPPRVQAGTASGMALTGYAGLTTDMVADGIANLGSGFDFGTATFASASHSGILVLTRMTGNVWVAKGALVRGEAIQGYTVDGYVALGGALDRIRITTVGGVNTFDAGIVNISWE